MRYEPQQRCFAEAQEALDHQKRLLEQGVAPEHIRPETMALQPGDEEVIEKYRVWWLQPVDDDGQPIPRFVDDAIGADLEALTAAGVMPAQVRAFLAQIVGRFNIHQELGMDVRAMISSMREALL